MDWGDLAKQVIGLGAPLLGTALGGPLGGAAGEILAKALGSEAPTPAAVQASMPSADPAKLAEAESLWAETIRAEIESNDVVQRWWRPAYAWELTLECGALWTVRTSSGPATSPPSTP
jgi:phage tail tape-measure protein